jgi:hypothetical protein
VNNCEIGWIKDLVVLRKAGPVRWTDPQLDQLKTALNSNGETIVADAIGSLQFDKIELQHRVTFLEDGIRAVIARMSTGEETVWSLLKKELTELFKGNA